MAENSLKARKKNIFLPNGAESHSRKQKSQQLENKSKL